MFQNYPELFFDFRLRKLSRAFTVEACKCDSNDVLDKLLTIIEAGCGTLDNFDAFVRTLEITFKRYKTRSGEYSPPPFVSDGLLV